MKRLFQLALLLAGFTWCVPAHATIAFDKCWGTNEIAAAATTITVSITPSAGELLVGYSRHSTNSTSAITFSDPNNTWSATGAGGLIANTGNNNAGQMWWATNAVAGTYTVTVTFGSSVSFRSVSVCGYTGADTSASPTDGNKTCVQNTTNTSCTTGTFSTANANDVIVYMQTVNNTGNTFAAGAIGGTTANLRAGKADDAGVEDRIVSSTQTNITAAMSFGTNQLWYGSCTAFKAAAASSTATPQQMMTGVGD